MRERASVPEAKSDCGRRKRATMRRWPEGAEVVGGVEEVGRKGNRGGVGPARRQSTNDREKNEQIGTCVKRRKEK